ncbi:hypothetical protein BJ165DRAFT_1494039 [Panaeolus papilionaceus]|nr:hypothetical protein BJ165DRAFT_1494039 [Panaeolus papilionaceus]
MIREYDVVGVGRGNFGGGGLNIGGRDGIKEVKPGYHPLDCNAQHRLAVARIKIGDEEEERSYNNNGSIILSSDVLDYSGLFLEIADAYFEREMYEVARAITNSIYVLLPTAACRKNIGEFGDAADVMSVTRPTTTPK